MPYSVHFPTQLREHLRALRKSRGLTQAGLGHLIGVGQARIAEIESNPGVVSLEQLMKLLAALRVSLSLHDEDAPAPVDASPPRTVTNATQRRSSRPDVDTPTKSPLKSRAKNVSGGQVPKTVLTNGEGGKRGDAIGTSKGASTRLDGPSKSSLRNYVTHPKKGAW